uniref:Uncharacterized protein n=1 Tax=Oryza punctata TaxID=4537 RepID=A0A0E0M061_ORYPU
MVTQSPTHTSHHSLVCNNWDPLGSVSGSFSPLANPFHARESSRPSPNACDACPRRVDDPKPLLTHRSRADQTKGKSLSCSLLHLHHRPRRRRRPDGNAVMTPPALERAPGIAAGGITVVQDGWDHRRPSPLASDNPTSSSSKFPKNPSG